MIMLAYLERCHVGYTAMCLYGLQLVQTPVQLLDCVCSQTSVGFIALEQLNAGCGCTSRAGRLCWAPGSFHINYLFQRQETHTNTHTNT